MADTRSARIALARLGCGFPPQPNFGRSPTLNPSRMAVHRIPVELYTPLPELVLGELGSPQPDRGISRGWPIQ